MKPHIHAEVIKAWADGKQIQFRWDDDGTWKDWKRDTPSFYPTCQYRIRPETIRYRVALCESPDGKWTMTQDDGGVGVDIEDDPTFARWLTDWIEVEV